MANGRSFGLATSVLASIYRGLNTISSSPTPSKSGASFTIHYVYAWVGHLFKSNRITHDNLSNPLMTKYSGVGYASLFSEFSTQKHIRTTTHFLWHGTAFKKSYDQTFIDNVHLSIQNQGIKGSLVVLARDAIKISEEEVRNDFDHKWKHLKSPMKGVDVGTSTNHAHLLTNNESSILKPSAKSSDLKRSKFANVGTSSKFSMETKRAPLSSLQPTNPPQVLMFQAKAHISSVRRKGASMLGDVLLNRLSNLSIDNILPQAEVHEIHSGVESLGVDPQHLHENVDKYYKGVADYLKMKESLNKRPSLVILIQREAEVEFLFSEASHEKASLNTELDTVRLRMANLQTELVQL
uniref:Uncharacterized protein n=1 Tax=Quercus lobata TaxID=97700 RepID=A0A7N2R3N6_QUELO